MGIIELFYDVHQIHLNSDKTLEELKEQGFQLNRLIELAEASDQKLAILIGLGQETNKKLDVLVVLALKLAKVLAPDEEEIVGISITPGPVTEQPKPTPYKPPS